METTLEELKEQIAKIPIGSYCYGSAIGEIPKIVDGKPKYTTISCPFWTENFCSFLKVEDFGLLEDQVKICGMQDIEDAVKVHARIGKPMKWENEKGEIFRFTKDGFEITNKP
ncbi:MAG: hypothetical protein POELPBGB_03625 [Bacteroidia bacterium]|nr:hypothetical protein [Bacteroidia bacterium]